MFVEGGGGWKPPPWQPPRRPKMTKRQERMLLWLVGFNVLALFVAPIGAASVVQAAVALFSHPPAPVASAALGEGARAR